MGCCGLTPSEYSSGQRTRRGHITKCGNGHLRAQLVESAWASQDRTAATLELRRRQHGLPPPEVIARAWQAQLRLCGRFRRLHARKQCRQVVVIAIARELAGFLWAEMVAEHAQLEAILPPVGGGVIVAAMTRRRPAAPRTDPRPLGATR